MVKNPLPTAIKGVNKCVLNTIPIIDGFTIVYMKIFVVVCKIDGVIQTVATFKKQEEAEETRRMLIEDVKEVIDYECSLMDNENNREKVRELRMRNSSVALFQSELLDKMP